MKENTLFKFDEKNAKTARNVLNFTRWHISEHTLRSRFMFELIDGAFKDIGCSGRSALSLFGLASKGVCSVSISSS